MWFTFAFWISLAATSISAVLVYLVLRANINKPGNLAAFVMFLGVFIWSFGEMIERIAGPPPHDFELAYLGALTLCVGVFLTPAGLIHFALDYPYRLKMGNALRKGVLYAVYTFSLLGIALIPFNSFLGNIVILTVNPYKAYNIYIWGLESGAVHKIFALWNFISAIILITVLVLKLKGVKMNIIKNQIFITLIGFIIIFILIVITSFVPIMLNIEMYPLNALAFSIFGMFVMYTIFKYRMFLVAPSSETVEESEELPDIEIYKMPVEATYEKFVRLVKSGNTGIAFVPENPEDFKGKYNLSATTVFQITQELGKDRLNPELPEHREMITFIITSLLEQVYKPVIMINLTPEWISEDAKRDIMSTLDYIVHEYGGVFLIATNEEQQEKDEEQ